MQILFSYVDLGLVDPRDMLLFGVALGIVGRSFTARAPSPRAPRRQARTEASASLSETTGAPRAERLVTANPG
jgi:hypothetical protein